MSDSPARVEGLRRVASRVVWNDVPRMLLVAVFGGLLWKVGGNIAMSGTVQPGG